MRNILRGALVVAYAACGLLLCWITAVGLNWAAVGMLGEGGPAYIALGAAGAGVLWVIGDASRHWEEGRKE